MRSRQRERGISDALVAEVMTDGLITDQHDSRTLHVSDHVIVISSGRDRVGITTFRHPMWGEWRADRSARASTEKNLETAYFFFQVCGGMNLISCVDSCDAVLSTIVSDVIRMANSAFMGESLIKRRVALSWDSGFRY
jgi:hypothetical protein